MKHDFIAAAVEERDKLPDFHPERIILTYFIQEAKGLENAKPWSAIKERLVEMGLHMSKEDFQQGLLKRSRSSSFYIGSSQSGYFLIVDRADAETMLDFYHKRIQAELAAMANLQKFL